MIRYAIIAFLMIVAFLGNAQKLHSYISQSTISIGQAFEVKYQLSADSISSIAFESFEDEIPVYVKTDSSVLTSGNDAIEILQPFSDTSFANNWMGRYTVTAWDSGIFIIPGPRLIFKDSTYQFDDLVFHCVLVPKKEDVDLYDIRESFTDLPDKPFDLLEFLLNWWLAILLVLIVLLIIWIKRRKPVLQETRRELSLKEKTLLAIDSLEEAKLWEKEKLKDHFVELSYIMRQYLSSRYSDSLMEKTTEEIRYYLIYKGLERDTIETISSILSSSDMVKFAKSEPDLIAIFKFSNLARQIVSETSPIEFESNE